MCTTYAMLVIPKDNDLHICWTDDIDTYYGTKKYMLSKGTWCTQSRHILRCVYRVTAWCTITWEAWRSHSSQWRYVWPTRVITQQVPDKHKTLYERFPNVIFVKLTYGKRLSTVLCLSGNQLVRASLITMRKLLLWHKASNRVTSISQVTGYKRTCCHSVSVCKSFELHASVRHHDVGMWAAAEQPHMRLVPCNLYVYTFYTCNHLHVEFK